VTLTPPTSRGGGAGGLFDAYAYLRDQKPAGTPGGTFNSGAWRTRNLNTEVFDVGGIVSLAGNQFTLQAGTYFIYARAPAFNVNRHQAKLRDVTNGVDALIGSSMTAATFNLFGYNDSIVSGRISPVAQTTYELQHRCEFSQADRGLGQEANFGVTEVYAEVWIYREAA
jgi:hypothetical protein